MLRDTSISPDSETMNTVPWRNVVLLLSIFGIAMGYFEAAIVVYLRRLFYPEGFSFPLVKITDNLILIEVGREAATIVMLMTLACAITRKRWSRFGWFVFVFGVWDIFYYVWLRVTIGWPETILDWDILFLIPLPWIGPVIALVLVASLMIMAGLYITRYESFGDVFHASRVSWLCAVMGTGLILWTFMSDLEAGFGKAMPLSYRYGVFAIGYVSYILGFIRALYENRLRKRTN